MVAEARFLFVTCQVGAEAALKREMAQVWPAFRLAFSRPGFVTFKLPDATRLADDFQLGCTLARTYGFSLGKVADESAETAAREAWRLVGDLPHDQLHVWQRDSAVPGDRGFEPGPTLLAEEVAKILVAVPREPPSDRDPPSVNQVAQPGERVLDCVLVEPNEWWLGWHVAAEPPSRWPGGVPPLQHTPMPISRAYWKIAEALAWSQLPVKPGDLCAEIGCAPGGAAQALLERGLHVLGIDPAEMDPGILDHPHFKQLRKRVADVKRREFRDVRWLITDSNIAPEDSLDDLEAIVTHREVRIRGLLATLKLSDWTVLESLPALQQRVRSWGFTEVMTRQLAFNRREICLAARRPRAQR